MRSSTLLTWREVAEAMMYGSDLANSGEAFWFSLSRQLVQGRGSAGDYFSLLGSYHTASMLLPSGSNTNAA